MLQYTKLLKKYRSNLAAFGLIEVLISASILSLSLLGVAAIQSRAMNAATDHSYQEAAFSLIQQLGKFVLATEDPTTNLKNFVINNSNQDYSACTATIANPNAVGCSLGDFYQHLVKNWENTAQQILPNGLGCTCWINNSGQVTKPLITIRLAVKWSTLTGSNRSTFLDYPINVDQQVTSNLTVNNCPSGSIKLTEPTTICNF